MPIAQGPLGITVGYKPLRRHHSQAARVQNASLLPHTYAGSSLRCGLGHAPPSARWRSRALSHPRSLQRASKASRRRCSAPPCDPPLPECTQYAGVKTRISQLQSQQLFPVDATAHGIRRLPVGEVFHELQHGNQSQAPRSLNCSASMRKERSKRLILVDRSKGITYRASSVFPWG